MQPGQPNEGQLRAKFRSVEVFSAATITQYWRAPFGLQQVQSAPTTGKAFLESDYFGNLRIYMPPGYEMETYPFELAEQIREFFTIAAEHRDLVLLALASEMERVEELFSSRGFGPLPEESVRNERENDEWTLADNDEPDMESLTLDDDTPQENRNADGKKKSHGSSRFGRMLNRKRFHPSFFNQDDDSPDSLPSYSRAVARTTQGATSSRTVHPARKLPPAFTLSLLESTITDMEFHQKDGAIVGAPLRPSSVLGFIKGLAQRDVNMGETIVCPSLTCSLFP